MTLVLKVTHINMVGKKMKNKAMPKVDEQKRNENCH